MPSLSDVLKHPVVSVATGAAASAVGGAIAVYRTCERLPVVGPRLRSGVAELSKRGDQVIAKGRDPIKALVAAIGAQIVELVLDEVDVTALVRERVDINAIAGDFDVDAILARIDVDSVVSRVDLDAAVARVDLDAAVARVDLDAAVAHVDLIGLANDVIEGVDLPAIIRESTGTVTAEVMADVRSQGERADDMVSGFVDRMLGRNREPE